MASLLDLLALLGQGIAPQLSQPADSFNDRFGNFPTQQQASVPLPQPRPSNAPGPGAPAPTSDQLFNMPAYAMAMGPAQQPQAAPAQQAQPQTAMPQQPAPLFGAPANPNPFDRLSAFVNNLGTGQGIVPGIMNGLQGLATGQRLDPQGMAIAAMNAKYQALLQSGVPDGVARAAALDSEVMKTVAPQIYMRPTLQKTGTVPLTGQDTFSWVNPSTQTMKEAVVTPAGAVPGSGATGAPSATQAASVLADAQRRGLSGRPMYDALPPQMKPIMDGILSYQIDPKNFGQRSGMAGQWMALAKQVDSSYDPASFDARHGAIVEFNKGGPNSPAAQIQTGNTFIQHLGELFNLNKGLGGTGNYSVLNKPINMLNEAQLELKNDPNLQAYKTLADKVVEEGTKFYRTTGGTEQDIMRGIQQLGAANSPEAREAAMRVLVKAAHGKVSAMQQRWETALGPTMWNKAAGTPPSGFPIFGPDSQSVINTVMGPQAQPAAAPASAPSLPTVNSPADAAKLPRGTRFRDPNGVERVVP